MDSNEYLKEINKNTGGGLSGLTPSVGFTRQNNTTAYAIGDFISDSGGLAMQFTVPFVSGLVRRVRLFKSGTGVASNNVRLWLHTSNPTMANADNGVWSPSKLGLIGGLDVNVDTALTDGAFGEGIPRAGSDIRFYAPSLILYGTAQALAAVPAVANEVWLFELELMPG